MALLIVRAKVEDFGAAPGNNLPIVAGVSVTDAAGVPVGGLVLANFTNGNLLVPTGGPAAPITAAAAGPQLGTYILTLTPGANWVWGRYVYSIRVINGANQGTNLADVLID
jgi:hypothetical protein